MIDLILLLVFARDLHDLGADDFHQRQAAEARLHRWSSLSWRWCCLPFRDLERRKRATRIAAPHLRLDDAPLINAFPLPGQPYACIWSDQTSRRRFIWCSRVWQPQGGGEILSAQCPPWLHRLAPYTAYSEYGEHVASWWLREQTEDCYRRLVRAGVSETLLRAVAAWMRHREKAMFSPQ